MDRKQAALGRVNKTKRPVHREGFLKMTDLRYDAALHCWWDLQLLVPHADAASINCKVLRADWHSTGELDSKGRPKLVAPSKYALDADNGLTVESTVWWPGMPTIIDDHATTGEGQIISYPGKRMLNIYRPPPTPKPLAGRDPSIWINHIKMLWPADYEYFLDYCAHMIQRPGEKCNGILVLSGGQGVGKDAALAPLKIAVGAHNLQDIMASVIMSDFTPWYQCVMLIISEMGSIPDVRASTVYEIIKPLGAAPPDTLRVNDKNMKARFIKNCLRPIITTNDMGSLYMASDDRRMMILHTNSSKRETSYYDEYWNWIHGPGPDIVASYLAERDISQFNPKAPPPLTAGKTAIISSWAPPDDALTAALDALQRPAVFFAEELLAFDNVDGDIKSIVRKIRMLGHRMNREGYWENRHEPKLTFHGKRTRAFRTSFFKDSLIGNSEEISRLTLMRGQMLADEIPQLIPKTGSF